MQLQSKPGAPGRRPRVRLVIPLVTLNLMAALARRQIIAKGPIPKILKLLPAVEPMYEMYPRILKEMGREDIVIKK